MPDPRSSLQPGERVLARLPQRRAPIIMRAAAVAIAVGNLAWLAAWGLFALAGLHWYAQVWLLELTPFALPLLWLELTVIFTWAWDDEAYVLTNRRIVHTTHGGQASLRTDEVTSLELLDGRPSAIEIRASSSQGPSTMVIRRPAEPVASLTLLEAHCPQVWIQDADDDGDAIAPNEHLAIAALYRRWWAQAARRRAQAGSV